MTRQPHARRVHLPPDDPPRESLAMALLGLAGIVLLFVLAFVLLPVLGGGLK